MLFRKLTKSGSCTPWKSARKAVQWQELKRISVDIRFGSLPFAFPQCARYVEKLGPDRQTFGQARKVYAALREAKNPYEKPLTR
jgi:hypothetical protein